MLFSGVTTPVSLTELIRPGISLWVMTNPNRICVEPLQQPLPVQSAAQAQSLFLDTRSNLRSSLAYTYTSFKHNLTAYTNNESIRKSWHALGLTEAMICGSFENGRVRYRFLGLEWRTLAGHHTAVWTGYTRVLFV